MKLRLRFNKLTKVFSVDDGREDTFTVDDLAAAAARLFGHDIDGDLFLSLNNKDPLDDSSKPLAQYDIVSGDLVYVVSRTARPQPALEQEPSVQMNPGASMEPQPEQSSSARCSNGSTPVYSRGTNEPTCTGSSSEATSDGTYDPASSGATSDGPYDPDSVTMETDDDPVDLTIVKQCLSEPVLCREAADGCVPSLLQEAYDGVGPGNESEALCVVLHVLMLETGFIVEPEAATSGSSCVPTRWKKPGHFQITYTYAGCTDVTCSLTIIPTGNIALAHGKVLRNDGATRQCSFKTSDYVKSTAQDCTSCYHQLARLSRVFKDSIANPLVHDARIAAGIEDVFGLLALTQEVKLRILSFLDVPSLLRMSGVNTEMLELSKDRYLWRRMYMRDFGNRHNNSLSQDWKTFYMTEYRKRKTKRRIARIVPIVAPPAWGPQNPFSGPSHWIPPNPGGIIGGDYDLYPNFPGSLPGIPHRFGPQPLGLPHPRYDLIGPQPDLDIDPDLLPRRSNRAPNQPGRGPRNPFGGHGVPRFF